MCNRCTYLGVRCNDKKMNNEKLSKKVILREVGISATKGAIGAIPFVGTALNEAIFESRGRIKQERVNKFIEMLQDFMRTVSEESINFQHLKSDEFSDIFESILKRIAYTRSEEKMKRFRKVLISEMQNPSDTDFTETFLDIISRLEEVQIKILRDIRIATKNCGGIHEKVYKIQNEIKKHEVQLKKELGHQENGFANNVPSEQKFIAKKKSIARKKMQILIENQKYYNSDVYGIEHSQYKFYVQDLISKALLQERLIPRNGKEPPVTQIIEISNYGEEFLNFLEEK